MKAHFTFRVTPHHLSSSPCYVVASKLKCLSFCLPQHAAEAGDSRRRRRSRRPVERRAERQARLPGVCQPGDPDDVGRRTLQRARRRLLEPRRAPVHPPRGTLPLPRQRSRRTLCQDPPWRLLRSGVSGSKGAVPGALAAPEGSVGATHRGRSPGTPVVCTAEVRDRVLGAPGRLPQPRRRVDGPDCAGVCGAAGSDDRLMCAPLSLGADCGGRLGCRSSITAADLAGARKSGVALAAAFLHGGLSCLELESSAAATHMPALVQRSKRRRHGGNRRATPSEHEPRVSREGDAVSRRIPSFHRPAAMYRLRRKQTTPKKQTTV